MFRSALFCSGIRNWELGIIFFEPLNFELGVSVTEHVEVPNLCLRQAQAPFNSGLHFDARSPNALGIGAASFAREAIAERAKI